MFVVLLLCVLWLTRWKGCQGGTLTIREGSTKAKYSEISPKVNFNRIRRWELWFFIAPKKLCLFECFPLYCQWTNDATHMRQLSGGWRGKGEAGNIAMHCFYGGQTQSRSDNITLCMITYSSKVNLGFMYSDLALGFYSSILCKARKWSKPSWKSFFIAEGWRPLHLNMFTLLLWSCSYSALYYILHFKLHAGLFYTLSIYEPLGTTVDLVTRKKLFSDFFSSLSIG